MDDVSKLDQEVNESDDSTIDQALEKLKKTVLSLIENEQIEVYQENGKYGIKDFLGFIIVKAQYNEIIVTEQEHYLVAFGRTELGWGLVCEYGEALKNQLFIFDEIPKQSIYANWFKVKVCGKYGIYDSDSGQMVLGAIYDELDNRNEFECVITKKDGKLGHFNYIFCVPPLYDDIVFGRGLAFVRFKKNGLLGYIDENLNWTEDIAKARILAKNPMFIYN